MIFYREVFKAKHRQTGKKVALKKVLMENEKEGVSVGGMAGLGLLSLGCKGTRQQQGNWDAQDGCWEITLPMYSCSSGTPAQGSTLAVFVGELGDV